MTARALLRRAGEAAGSGATTAGAGAARARLSSGRARISSARLLRLLFFFSFSSCAALACCPIGR